MDKILITLFREFLQLSKEVTEALKQAGILPDVNGSTRTETPSPESPVAGPSGASGGLLQPDGEEDRYKRALKPLQYEGIEFASKISPGSEDNDNCLLSRSHISQRVGSKQSHP